MRINLTRMVAAVGVTAAIAGGGAALASAATGDSSTVSSTPTTTTPTTTTATTPSKAMAPSGTHHCPGMSGSSGSGASYAPGPGQAASV